MIHYPHIINKGIFFLTAILLLIAPLMRGGRHPNSPLILELIAISLLFLTLVWYTFRKQLSWLQISFLLFSCLILIIYLIPLPFDIWQGLPGRLGYVGSIEWLLANEYDPYLALSIVPQKSIHAFLAILPLIAIFLSTISLSSKQQIHLVYWILLIVAFEAALGLIQYSNQGDTWMWFSGRSFSGSAQGSYFNRDHYANLMLMSFPIALGLLARNIDNGKQGHRSKLSLNHVLIFGFVTVLVLLAAIFSRSRAGLGLVIVGVFISTLVFGRHLGGKKTIGLTATLGVFGFGAALSIGLIPVLNRFATDPGEDERWRIFRYTIEGVKEFFPWGSGPGTFQELYRSFQPADQPKFWNHAHNDYLELFFDIGIFAALVILLFFLIYVLGWLRLKNNQWDTMRFVKTGAGIGMILVLLHSLVDFNFHTPANAIWFCFLTAIFLKPVESTKEYLSQ